MEVNAPLFSPAPQFQTHEAMVPLIDSLKDSFHKPGVTSNCKWMDHMNDTNHLFKRNVSSASGCIFIPLS